MLESDIFILSFFLYSAFRFFDVESTRIALRELNIEMHEVNFFVVPLTKKFGFNKAMIVTWLLFAIPIGLLDTLYMYPLIGFPPLWLLFGIFHMLAAANNVQVYFQAKEIGADNVERNAKILIRKLRELSAFRKVTYLMKVNFLHLCLTIYGLIALFLFSILLSTMVISFKAPTSFLLIFAPPIMILDLILFFPVLVFGSIVISYRQLKIFDDGDFSSEEIGRYVNIPVDILRTALEEAEKTRAKSIPIFIPHED